MTSPWRPLVGLTLVLVACRAGDRRAGAPADSTNVAATGDTTASGMPPFPDAGPRQLAVRAAGRTDLNHTWTAEAGLCEQPPFLQIQGSVPGFGVLLALSLPAAAGDRVSRYPVTFADTSGGIPPAPAAQLGVQKFTEKGSFAFQAREGDVELYAFGAQVSGRFAVTLREIATEDRVKLAGAFTAVPVQLQSRAYCDGLAAAAARRGPP